MTAIEKEKARSKARIIHPDFAKRLERACDGNPHVPPLQYGRLNWFVEQLSQHDVHVSIETVRKWFVGETRPRPRPQTALAKILQVDETWLANGANPEMSLGERRKHNVVAGGAVNVIAGFIQMHGGFPAFPLDDDVEAKDRKIDLYAVIRGAKYAFHILTPIGEGDKQHFIVPHEANLTVVLGVVQTGNFSVKVYELDWDRVSTLGSRKANGFDVKLHEHKWREVESFAERF